MTTSEGAAEYLQRRGLVLMPPGAAVTALGQAVAAGDVTVTVLQLAGPDAQVSPGPFGDGISLDEMDGESLLRLAPGDPEN
jgi:hypothetical protein